MYKCLNGAGLLKSKDIDDLLFERLFDDACKLFSDGERRCSLDSFLFVYANTVVNVKAAIKCKSLHLKSVCCVLAACSCRTAVEYASLHYLNHARQASTI